jgi:hypothetical protein
MPEEIIVFKNSRISKIFFLLSVLVFAFWCLGQIINVYRFAVVGAIFEILWLPMLAMLLVLPIMSFIFWVNEKFNLRSFYLFTILIVVMTVLLMVFRK